EGQARIGRVKRRSDRRQQVRGDGRNDAQPPHPGERVGQPQGGIRKLVRAQEIPPGPVEKLPPGRRDENLAPIPLEERDAQASLEGRDLRRQRRLSDATAFGGLVERERVGDRSRVLELAQREGMRGVAHDSYKLSQTLE